MVCITGWPLSIFAFPMLSPRRSHPFHGFSFILYTEHTPKYYPKPLLCVWETSYRYYLSNIYTYIWMSPIPFKAPMSKSELMIFFFGNGLQKDVQISISWVLLKKELYPTQREFLWTFYRRYISGNIPLYHIPFNKSPWQATSNPILASQTFTSHAKNNNSLNSE